MNTIKICNQKYKVKTVTKPFYNEEGEELEGDIDFEKKVIRLKKYEDKNLMKITLMHEVFHGIVFESHMHQIITRDTEEILAELVGQNLALIK